jgi:hypothetical protein
VGSSGQRERTSANGRTTLMKGVHWVVRDIARVREGIGADMPVPQSSERERERGRVWDRLIGGGRLSGRVGAGTGWADQAGLGRNGFSLFPGISNAFLFYFPRVFNSNSNQVSNSN